jgi:hypothetical protein
MPGLNKIQKRNSRKRARNRAVRAVQPRKARDNNRETRLGGERGPKRACGRPPGSQNFFSREIKESVIRAANKVGLDGKGTGGMDGYLVRVALENQAVFCGLLRAVMGTQVTLEQTQPPKRYETLEEVLADLKSRGIVPLEQKTLPHYHGPEIELDAVDVSSEPGEDEETR